MNSHLKRTQNYMKVWESTNSQNYSMKLPDFRIWEEPSGITEVNDKVRTVVIDNDPLKSLELAYKDQLRCLYVIENDGTNPMPGIASGSVSDAIFLRSNICKSFTDNTIFTKAKEGELLILSDVIIYKDENFNTSISYKSDVAIAVPKKLPALIGMNDRMLFENESDLEYTRNIIEKIFKAGQEYECLVMGDFGCSYLNQNPISVIVDIINEMLSKYPIPIVVFCVGSNSSILDDHECDDRYRYFYDFINR